MKACFFLLLLGWSCQLHAQQSDTFSVYFPMDVRQLSTDARHEIDSLFYADWLNVASYVVIVGYADYVGGAGTYNNVLSRARAENVAQFLKAAGIRPENIRLIEGKGAVERANISGNKGYAPDRRVDIVRGNNKLTPPPAPTAQPAPAPAPDIAQLKENETLTLDNIYFYPGQHVVRPESYPAMEQLLHSLQKNPNVRVRIEGHICCITNGFEGLDIDTGEPLLSQNRARFIYHWLIDHGISKDRLEWKGFGRSRPLIPVEKSEADANKNRRVEIRLLSR